MKKGSIILLVVFLILTGIEIAAYFLTSRQIVLDENDVIIVERKTIYGETSGLFTLRLYSSGKIFFEGGGSTRSALVSDEDMTLFYQAIVDTDVMNKTCRSGSGPPFEGELMDFFQKTTLTIDDNRKVISAPFCENELNAILSTVNKYVQNK